VEKEEDRDYAEWDFVCLQVTYTPIHWLAYWDDVESINYILSLIQQSKEQIIKTMMPNIRNITPLDVAGKH